MGFKGIDNVRRDRWPLLRGTMEKCLRTIFIDRDIDGAVETVRGGISDLLQGKVGLNMLTITKGWSKDKYVTEQAHVELAKRMMARDPNVTLGQGDRIPYVVSA